MKYPDSPPTPPSPLDSLEVGLIKDEGGSLIPVSVGDIDLANLPEGVELQKLSVAELNEESRSLLGLQLKRTIDAEAETLAFYENIDRRRTIVQTSAGLLVLLGTGLGEYYANTHGIPHIAGQGAGFFQTAGSLFGGVAGYGITLGGIDHTNYITRRIGRMLKKNDHVSLLIEHVSRDPESVPSQA